MTFTTKTALPFHRSPARGLLGALVLLAAGTVASAQAPDRSLPQPKTVRVAPGMTQDEAKKLLLPALRYYAFWNTGDERFASEALASNFVDLNLPEGRPQGPNGPLVASKKFRKAVPDLKASAEEVWVSGDQVIGRLRFTGHFAGVFGKLKGKGQPIAFNAVDIYTVKDGRIVANWHLEDNLTLMRQLGAVSAP